jgi:xylan 1,4-beta-xylosidase
MTIFSRRYRLLFILGFLAVNCFAQNDLVSIHVDLTREKGPMKPLWAWFGYDEPNFTYMKAGTGNSGTNRTASI